MVGLKGTVFSVVRGIDNATGVLVWAAIRLAIAVLFVLDIVNYKIKIKKENKNIFDFIN